MTSSSESTRQSIRTALPACEKRNSVERVTDEPLLDLLLRGITAVRTVGFSDVDAVLLNAANYLAARTEKGDTAGGYQAGSSLDANAPPYHAGTTGGLARPVTNWHRLARETA